MSSTQPTEHLLDLAHLRDLHAAVGDQLSGVLASFSSFVEQSLHDIRQAVRDQDAAALILLTHSLKGSAANLGAPALSNCSAALEQIARAGNLAAIDGRLPDLVKVAEGTLHSLRRYEPTAR